AHACLSQALGYGVLAGACITKLPQIVNVLKSGSAEGLSPLSFELETGGLLVHASYGYVNELPFSAYGEAFILFIQSLYLLLLIYRLARIPSIRPAFSMGLMAAYIAAVYSGRVDSAQVGYLFNANNFVFMAARLPQIHSNWRTKNTGQLSLVTCCINTLGCVVRIFTSITEGAGLAMVRGYSISLLLNAILVAQIFMYAPSKKKDNKSGAGKQE
ncbi:hypothetical protein DUNSADRAFT_6675, partial [Dunaliella salina]